MQEGRGFADHLHPWKRSSLDPQGVEPEQIQGHSQLVPLRIYHFQTEMTNRWLLGSSEIIRQYIISIIKIQLNKMVIDSNI